jgi:trehalose 6-phosphate phosphatase
MSWSSSDLTSQIKRPPASAVPQGVLDKLRANPATAGLFLDYDGTLAPIVDDPALATPVPGTAATLELLGRSFGVVAVVSGRPARFLGEVLGRPPGVRLIGLYGLEELAPDGSVVTGELAAGWETVVADAVHAAVAEAPDGLGVEDKRLSLTLHWRTAPALEPWAREFAVRIAARTGLVPHGGRASIELRPPVDVDKGSVLRRLARECQAIGCFGDDRGDIPAFVAAGELAGRGAVVVRVVVSDSETPPELLDLADVVVEGPSAAHALLATLAVGAP